MRTNIAGYAPHSDYHSSFVIWLLSLEGAEGICCPLLSLQNLLYYHQQSIIPFLSDRPAMACVCMAWIMSTPELPPCQGRHSHVTHAYRPKSLPLLLLSVLVFPLQLNTGSELTPTQSPQPEHKVPPTVTTLRTIKVIKQQIQLWHQQVTLLRSKQYAAHIMLLCAGNHQQLPAPKRMAC